MSQKSLSKKVVCFTFNITHYLWMIKIYTLFQQVWIHARCLYPNTNPSIFDNLTLLGFTFVIKHVHRYISKYYRYINVLSQYINMIFQNNKITILFSISWHSNQLFVYHFWGVFVHTSFYEKPQNFSKTGSLIKCWLHKTTSYFANK